MKITNSEVIKSGEQELIDGITGDLDWGTIEQIFREEHKVGIREDVEFKRGDIVAHENQVVYRLEFEVKLDLSVFLDREGNYISMTSSGDLDTIPGKIENNVLAEPKALDRRSEAKTDEYTSIPPGTESDQQKDNIEENQLSPDIPLESEKKDEAASGEIDSSDSPESIETSASVEASENSMDRISQTAGQAGEMVAQLGDETQE